MSIWVLVKLDLPNRPAPPGGFLLWLRLLHRGDGGDAAAADGLFDALAGVACGGVTITVSNTVTTIITVTITAPAVC